MEKGGIWTLKDMEEEQTMDPGKRGKGRAMGLERHERRDVTTDRDGSGSGDGRQ